MKVICISGKAQHGKDTSASVLKEILEGDGFSVLVTHYGDLVKYVCTQFFGWDGQKDVSGRHLLQYVGTDIIRTRNPDYWVAFVASILNFFKDRWDYVLIPDCRFPNEVDYLKECGFDVTHMRVSRTNFDTPLTKDQQNHPSETALDDAVADYYITNNGTQDDLRNAIYQLKPYLVEYHQISFDELENETESKNPFVGVAS